MRIRIHLFLSPDGNRIGQITWSLLLQIVPRLFMIFLLVGTTLSGQKVVFNKQSALLSRVTGTLGQAKCGADINGDGRDDITRISKDGIHVDFQTENGLFRHEFFPMEMQVLPEWSICAGDLNNDGLNDLFMGGLTRVSYLISDVINHRFVEKKLEDFIVAQRSNFIDLDHDGYLDAFVCHDSGQSKAYRNLSGETLIWDNDLISTSTLPGNYSSIWTDYNNDGMLDLYMSKCLPNVPLSHPARTNLLYKNLGNQQFKEVAQEAGVNDNAQSWTTVVEDFDHDGDFDFFVVNHDEKNRFYRNNNDGTFTDIIDITGVDAFDLGAFEAVGGDFNNDGHMDIISELNQTLYLGRGDLTFEGQSLPFSPGAVGDFNDDGYLDITEGNQLWLNQNKGNHYVKIILKGWESNHNGIGARLTLESESGKQYRELRAGESYSPMNSLTIHFGVGKDTIVQSLDIRWPSGVLTNLKNLLVDSTYVIPEGFCLLPADSIFSEGKNYICPGDSIVLTLGQRYEKYRWNGSFSTPMIITTSPGYFRVMYRDSAGCTGISLVRILENPDVRTINLEFVEGKSKNCAQELAILKSNIAEGLVWSSGQRDQDTIHVHLEGLYFASLGKVCEQGSISSDSIYLTFSSVPAPTNFDVIPFSSDSIKLKVEGENCFWYADSVDHVPIAKGCEIILDSSYRNKTVYAESTVPLFSEIIYAGKPDTTGFFTQIADKKSMHFTLQKPVELQSVTMYLSSDAEAGIRQIYMINQQGDSMLLAKPMLEKGKNTIPLHTEIKPGSYQLTCDINDQKTNVGPWDYPYPIGNSGTIDSSSSGRNFYPFFYEWKIVEKWDTCHSERTPFLINVSSLKNEFWSNNLKIYPNPANDKLFIEQPENLREPLEYFIVTMEGKKLKPAMTWEDHRATMHLSDMPAGCYRILWIGEHQLTNAFFIIVR